jgi:hypothetical protein
MSEKIEDIVDSLPALKPVSVEKVVDESSKDVDAEMLQKIGEGLVEEAEPVDNSIGKDLQLVAKELTDDRNLYRFSNIEKKDVPDKTMQLVMADSLTFPRKGGRFLLIASWVRNESMLLQSVTGKKTSNMADRYKDLGGYLLAFGGGIEWRQAGFAPDSLEGQKEGILARLKK